MLETRARPSSAVDLGHTHRLRQWPTSTLTIALLASTRLAPLSFVIPSLLLKHQVKDSATSAWAQRPKQASIQMAKCKPTVVLRGSIGGLVRLTQDLVELDGLALVEAQEVMKVEALASQGIRPAATSLPFSGTYLRVSETASLPV